MDATPLKREDFYRNLRHSAARRYPAFDPLSMEVLFNLLQAVSCGEASLSSLIKSRGLSLPGLNVLSVLREHKPAGCPLNTLSNLLLVTRANITGLVDGLVRKGYASRREHPHDRRITLATITAAGERWLDSYLPHHYAQIRSLLSGLTRPEKKTLAQLLAKLHRSEQAAQKGGKA